MKAFALALFVTPALLGVYTYVLYPVLLRVVGGRRVQRLATEPAEWPTVSISVPVYNEAIQIRDVLDGLLALDYPRSQLQILVISDASTDGTDDIVREYAERGVELLRMPQRGGKTVGENAGAVHLRGELVVNTDASIRIRRDALKALVRQFNDPTVGVASGRDLSVGTDRNDSNAGEAGYVGYEMGVRALETRAGGIVGASGCLYAIRAHLHRSPLPGHLSRDFAAALIAHEHGYRAVSVDDAVCYVPRTTNLEREYRRKVRTMSRGMETLQYKRHLLNPLRHGSFAWKLWSHKVCRWLLPPAGLLGALGLTLLALTEASAALLLLGSGLVLGVAYVGWRTSASMRLPRGVGFIASAVAANVAVLHAIVRACRRDEDATWEPTRRETILRSELGS